MSQPVNHVDSPGSLNASSNLMASKLPYNPISDFYKTKFGEKVFKIPVSLAEDCPNRAGLKGMKTCIFCDEWGSFAFPKSQNQDLNWQIQNHKQKIAERFNSKKFIVYFQAYTTTFTQFKKIKESFEAASADPDIVGLVVGTRPDCLSEALLELWHEYSQKKFLGIELGIQSFDNKQLEWMRRGHTHEQSLAGIKKIQTHCPNVDLGIHLIFGWPGETLETAQSSAKLCNELGVSNVKLHNLHVLKNTPLAELYYENKFKPIEFDEYCSLVGEFLLHLNPKTYIHRLSALSSHAGELIAPDWTAKKMTSYQNIIDYLNNKNIVQGKQFV